jgi:hypothetical protein
MSITGGNGTININNADFYITASSSRMGVGTTSPSANLHVVGDVLVGSELRISENGTNTVAIGRNAGQTQGTGAVAIGNQAGQTDQGGLSVAIGQNAGQTSQGAESFAMGHNAGAINQGEYCFAFGTGSGFQSQQEFAIAIGWESGKTSQGATAVAIGQEAGITNQGESAVAIGYQAGYSNQGASAVAIGDSAGRTNQGSSSVAIGRLANAPTNSVVLNGTGSAFSPSTTNGFFVKPIKTDATKTNALTYDATTGQIFNSTLDLTDATNITTGTLGAAQIPNLDASKITSGVFSGNGSGLSSLNASNISSGTLNSSRIPNLDASKITTGVFSGNGSGLSTLNASNISSGTLNAERIPTLDINSKTSGTLNADRIPDLNASKITTGVFSGNGSGLSSLNASNISSGTLNSSRIPNLDASKITSGVFSGNGSGLSSLNASNISSGTLNSSRIPNLDASKITTGVFSGNGSGLSTLNASNISSGTLNAERIPTLDINSKTSGTLNADRIPDLNASKITSGTFSGNGSGLSSLNASNISSGTLNSSRIPNLDASKITTGVFSGNGSGLSSLNASNISSGTLNSSRIPNLDASKITTGVFSGNGSGLSSLNASNITSGTLSGDGGFLSNISDLTSITKGSASLIPQITFDAKGRISSVTETAVQNQSNVEAGTAGQVAYYSTSTTVKGNSALTFDQANSNVDVTGNVNVVGDVVVGSQLRISENGTNTVAIGRDAGQTQGTGAVAIGNQAGQTNQGLLSVAIGQNAGQSNQGGESFAMGHNAGAANQADYCFAFGTGSGFNSQQEGAIAIGWESGKSNQGEYAVAIGYEAGLSNQGDSSVAIGLQANAPTNSVVLNGTGTSFSPSTTNGFFVKPIKTDSTKTNALTYDATTGQIFNSTLDLTDATNLTTGTLNNARLPSTISVSTLIGDGSGLSSLNASNIISGTLNNARLPSDITVSGTISGAALSTGGSLSFGSSTRQMINLYNTTYGIGIQNSTYYFRTDGYFAWYRGGVHNNNILTAGGGTTLMTLDTNGTLKFPQASSYTPRIQIGTELSYSDDSLMGLRWGGNGDMGMGLYSSAGGVFGKQGLAIHIPNTEEFSIKTTNWTQLFGVDNTRVRVSGDNTRATLEVAATSEGGDAEMFFGTPFNSVSPYKTAIIAEGIGSWSRSKLHFCLDNTTSNDPSYRASISDARMTIQPDGNVGIGTDSPHQKLDVRGGNMLINWGGASIIADGTTYNSTSVPFSVISNPTSGVLTLGLQNSTTTGTPASLGFFREDTVGNSKLVAGIYSIDGTDTNNAADGGLDFRIAKTGNSGGYNALDTAMRIDSSSSVGIGTTTPVATLDVGEGTSSHYLTNANAVGVYDYSTASEFQFDFQDYFGIAAESLMGGSTWENFQQSVFSLDGTNTGKFGIHSLDNIVTQGSLISSAGGLVSSDSRIKRDIVDVSDTEALDMVRNLAPKKYRYRRPCREKPRATWTSLGSSHKRWQMSSPAPRV